MLTIKDIYYLCQRDQAAHSESGEAVIIFYSRWGTEGYITLSSGILIQWGRFTRATETIYVPFTQRFSVMPTVIVARGNQENSNWGPSQREAVANVVTEDGFYFHCNETAGSNSQWIAIGY